MKSKQRGLSFLGLVIVGAFLAFVGVIGAQVAPTIIEFQAINKAAKKAATEGSTVADVRRIFDAASAIDDFKAISGKDLEVSKEGDKIVTKFTYNKEIHIGGPAYLLLKYAGSSR